MNDKHSMKDMSDRRSVGGSLAGRGTAAPGGPRMARAAAWPRMASAALLSCAAALAACGGGGGSSTAPPEMTPPGPTPPPAQAALTVMAGGSASGGGSVSVAVGSGVAGVVGAGASSSVAAAGDTVTLTATAADGWAFAGWTLSGGLACADGPAGNPCTLAAGSLSAGATAEAAFALVATTLTVSAGPNGSVAVEATVDGGASEADVSGPSQGFAFNVEATATLTAVPDTGHAFSAWTGACAGQGAACALDGVAGSTATAAAFDPVATTLTVSAGAGGSVAVEATVGGGASEADVPGPSQGFAFNVEATATLTAEPDTGYAFSAWTGACAGQGAACALDGVAGSTATAAAFDPVATTLTVAAGAGGSVAVEATVDGGGSEADVSGPSQGFAFNVEATATLTAEPDPGYAFSAWTGACAGQGAACALDGVAGSTATTAAFALVATTLTVSAGANGSVDVEATVDAVAGGAVTVDAANPSREFPFNVEATATLTAVPDTGHAFSAWTGACAGQGAACALNEVVGDAEAAAAFVVLSTLTVTAGPNGSVAVEIGVADVMEVGADSSQGFTVSVLSAATLTATAGGGHTFTGWTLSGLPGLACASGAQANPCVLPAGSLSAGATVEAAFARAPAAWRGPGSVSVSLSGSTHTAVPYAPGAFENWAGAPCDGSAQPECDVSSVADSAGFPAAVFRPFAVGGIKSLAFGLGYHGDPPDHFEVSFRDASDAGFTPVPGLGSLAPGSEPARLAVPVHLLPWGVRAYMTEACDAANSCAMAASGGQQTLEQTDSVAATGYFKAPNADANDQFGWDIALSGDGATLAVGTPQDDSASTGTFAPGEAGYQAALDSDGANNSGAVTVYRRSGSTWRVEAFVKAPEAGANDQLGGALALSRDGATLAVGAPEEDSASTGTFAAPDGEGYQAALDDNDADNSGAVTVYRRSGSTWRVEAFVKAPEAGTDDGFGTALALSADGATLAVSAPFEDSASTGTFAPTDEGYQAALDDNGASQSGAVTVYRRSDVDSRWTIEAFVKAPEAGLEDGLGYTSSLPGHPLALSADGATLAVGAYGEDSASTGTFAAPDGEGYQAALDDNDADNSGAAYVYRRSVSTWRVEAFIKAPDAQNDDDFGITLALSGDGATLAVSAPFEDSASTGTFAPTDEGYQAALRNNSASESGAVTVYRRSDVDSRWTIEAFVKAPNAAAIDWFGLSLDLSSGGVVMAVGSSGEDSSFSGVFAPDDPAYQAALDNNGTRDSGAAYIYRHPPGPGAWTVGNFVKAPKADDADDSFGSVLALSDDGATLAVGAINEAGGALSQPAGGRSANTGNALGYAGAVYLY